LFAVKRRSVPTVPVLISVVLAALLLSLFLARDAGSPELTGDDHHERAAREEVAKKAYFWRPPLDASAQEIAARKAHVTLTHGDESKRDALIEAGMDPDDISVYMLAEVVLDTRDIDDLWWWNNAAYEVGDFEDIWNNHEDWFLLDEGGERMIGTPTYISQAYGTRDWYLMDPGAAGWRDFFVGRLSNLITEHDWRHVYLDNIELSLAKRLREGNGTVPGRYPTDAAWAAATRDFAEHVRRELQQRHPGVKVFANLIEIPTRDSAEWHRTMAVLDGGMEEAWGAGWTDDAFFSPSDWLDDVRRIERSQAEGKDVWVVAQGSQGQSARQNFLYASYLLANQGNAYFRYAHSRQYDEAWHFDNYRLQLGQPTGERLRDGRQWTRDFEFGSVTVDPSAHTATIEVDRDPSLAGIVQD
jgi:hypothetical protein